MTLFRRTLVFAVLSAIGVSTAVDQSAIQANAQTNPQALKIWTAQWITHPTAPLREPGVFHFRKFITLPAKPEHFPVEVSADSRFILFVNGTRIGEGPAKSDLQHWHYETFDLAPALHAGENTLAATVWNFGVLAPLAVISDRTAFLMQGDGPDESAVNTDSTWEVEEEPGLTFIPRVANGFYFYWAADPGEKLDARLYDWDWDQKGESSRSQWVPAADPMRGQIFATDDIAVSHGREAHNQWSLMPDTLPQMEFRPVEAGKVVRTTFPGAEGFPTAPVTIPANASVEILLDRSTMVSGYPELQVSGGSGAQIAIGYTEALYDEHNRRGNRNDVGNRKVLGLFDEFIADGGPNRRFMPLWPRTWRYLELKIKTADAPLKLQGLHVYFSAYPFQERGFFHSDDAELGKIWDICWRTDRLDARETYMDTPFWEQLQYIEDTRIQALTSYTIAGDDRLARQALHAFDESRVPDGLTQSRYPSLLPQFIPNFSLTYIDMLHDYWMYRPDQDILKELVPRTRPILQWFFERELPDGFLGKIPYWSAIDSPRGIKVFPRTGPEGRSALLTLLFVKALNDAADLEDAFGNKSIAAHYRSIASRSAKAVYDSCWDAKLGLLADTPAQDSFSQHTNIFGILTDTIPQSEQASVLRKILAFKQGDRLGNEPEAMVSLHYQFYLSRAIDKTGAGDLYLATLAPWRTMLSLGLTTTPEYADPTRSDTHAWSAHPAYDFLTIVAGIHPGAPGFKEVRLSPHPGALNSFEASMPHPSGTIGVRFKRKPEGVQFEVDLPQGINGTLQWNGQDYSLHGGSQSLSLGSSKSAF